MSSSSTPNDTKKRVVLWHRNDLRVHDNLTLHEALKRCRSLEAAELVPTYIFDPRFFSVNSEGFDAERKKRYARCMDIGFEHFYRIIPTQRECLLCIVVVVVVVVLLRELFFYAWISFGQPLPCIYSPFIIYFLVKYVTVSRTRRSARSGGRSFC